jgi:hypothetical protein
MKHLSVHFNVHPHIQIVFLNNFEYCRSPFKMKPFTRRGPKIGKNHQTVVMSKQLTFK